MGRADMAELTLEQVCQRIFDIALPAASAASAPVAGINIGVTDSCSFSETELWEGFNKVRWDTALASAELQIIHKDGDYGVKVLSLELFEEEDVSDTTIPIADGVVF